MPATATMEQVAGIAAAYRIERCEVDVINTTVHVAAYRGPALPAASALHIVQSRFDGLHSTGGRRPSDRSHPRG